jgi:hypothetical protein
MAILRDEEEQKGQGTSQALGQPVPDQQQVTSAPQPQTTPASGPATIGASSAPSAAPSQAMPKQQKAGTGSFSNLKNYLQAAQGGGQQKVAQAATQQVQRLGTGAQKGLQQAQQTFGTQLQAGSLAGMETAGQEAKDIIGAARGTVYQAPQPAQQQTESAPQQETSTPPQPTTPQPQQYFTPEQQQRFAEIINAQYQGPMSLQQGGLYEQAASKARTAQQAAELTQSAEGRSQLLRDVFGRSRDYSRGASRLDSLLLNASEQGVKQLQEQAQPALQSQQALQAAQNLSANEAAQRKAAIEQIQSGARTAFTGARSEEEKAVEDRLSKVVENWDQLPEYFRELLKNNEKGALNLSQQEADLLGVRAGEGIYNLTPDQLIQTSAAERDRLITKNELSRQLALQQLANLDRSSQLQKDLQFTDLEKAGTQTSADAINRAAIRDVLDAEEAKFRETAAGQNVTGYGEKKHRSSGKRYYAQETANLKDVLERAGYDFSPSSISSDKIADSATGSLSRDSDQLGFLGEVTNPYGSGASVAEQAARTYLDFASGGVVPLLRGLGVDISGTIASALGGTVSSKYAKNIASQFAREDLQRRVTEALKQSGFSNRAAVQETEQTKARQAALADILTTQEKYRG